MDRYRKPGMEYRFHDDAGEAARLTGDESANSPSASQNGDEAGAVADGMEQGDTGGLSPS